MDEWIVGWIVINWFLIYIIILVICVNWLLLLSSWLIDWLIDWMIGYLFFVLRLGFEVDWKCNFDFLLKGNDGILVNEREVCGYKRYKIVFKIYYIL